MVLVPQLLYSEPFTNTDTVTVQHDLGRANGLAVQVIVDAAITSDVAVVTDPVDPTNKFTVMLPAPATGIVQVFSSGYVLAGELSHQEMAALQASNPTPSDPVTTESAVEGLIAAAPSRVEFFEAFDYKGSNTIGSLTDIKWNEGAINTNPEIFSFDQQVLIVKPGRIYIESILGIYQPRTRIRTSVRQYICSGVDGMRVMDGSLSWCYSREINTGYGTMVSSRVIELTEETKFYVCAGIQYGSTEVATYPNSSTFKCIWWPT